MAGVVIATLSFIFQFPASGWSTRVFGYVALCSLPVHRATICLVFVPVALTSLENDRLVVVLQRCSLHGPSVIGRPVLNTKATRASHTVLIRSILLHINRVKGFEIQLLGVILRIYFDS